MIDGGVTAALVGVTCVMTAGAVPLVAVAWVGAVAVASTEDDVECE